MAKAKFAFAPGAHYESANIRNLLRTYGVEVSEARVFGVAGGITAAYQFCPSVPGNESVTGSGINFIGRVKMYSTGGVWYTDFFDRVGVKTDVRETGGVKGAAKNLLEGLQAGRPVVAWTTPMEIAPIKSWTGTCGMYTVVVSEVNEAKGTATVHDHAGTAEVSLEKLEWARNRVCSLKNRSLTVAGDVKISEKQWQSAMLSGLRETAGDFVKPRLGSFSLPGLLEGTKMINNATNKRGWLAVFPGSKIFLPMRDAFETIETGSTGGSLFRPLYAEFLEDAAGMLGKKDLKALAGEYRKLGEQWTAFAEGMLPDKVKPFAETKKVLRKMEKGDRGGQEKLEQLRVAAMKDFPWDEGKTRAFLDESAEKLKALYDREAATAKMRCDAVG
jgi:hypothetical protein